MKLLKLLLATTLLCSTNTLRAQKYVGGDISLLSKYEANGAKYMDKDGKSITDVLTFLKEQGLNTMRVRLFVDPSNATQKEKGEGVCQDLEYVKTLGKKIKDAGLKFMLDFHYSDTWADPAKQWTPNSWTEFSDEQLYTKIYDYTKESLQALKEAGVEPDFIQTGNEISYGMVWGKAVILKDTYDKSSGKGETVYDYNVSSHKKCYSNSSTANWTRFYNLLKQAGKACKEICPNAKVILHTERIAATSFLIDYYKRMIDNNVDFDIIGTSYYPYYHGKMSQLNIALNQLETNFPNKKIMVVETGCAYHYTVGDKDKQYYDLSYEGQRKFTEELVTTLNSHQNVNGLFWWFLEANEYGLDWNTKRVTDGWYNASLFDNETGKALPALYELKNFNNGSSGFQSITTEKKSNDNNWYTIEGRRLGGEPSKSGVYINQGKKKIVR